MPITLFLSLLQAMLGLAAAEQPDQVRTLVVQEEVIMRIPVRPRPMQPDAWEVQKGPKCIDASTIRGAALSGRESVDLMLYDRSRVRAELSEDCPALDFYNGFYVTPENGKLCAKRDDIHSRIGRSCRIERFRRLVPRVLSR
ncbi:hypothetical protein GCM10023264_25670 [Sphingomonas daechungensis]|uniref:DUF3617 family protein n=1 Tax=Sphingomonas daechungensis TaxID=1176646 RepID=A0ABX6T3K2_9SPHN|nr:hypothetical protein [Sphingomonas daechungensis]QNP43482.1 hypothetical protein H9L15_01350 [Sphingomonas daechungensis]